MIRLLTPSDIADFAPIGKKFFDETGGDFTARFDVDYFSMFWEKMIESGHAIVVGAWVNGVPSGGIGGIIGPDPCNGDTVVSEAFWFVDPAQRGCGIKLFKTYLKLASKVSKRQMMGHLLSSMPEKLEKLYMREGFRPVETNYLRES